MVHLLRLSVQILAATVIIAVVMLPLLAALAVSILVQGLRGHRQRYATAQEFDSMEVARRQLDDGRTVIVQPLLFGAALLGVGSKDYFDGGYCDVWDYPSRKAAVDAMEAWDGTGEPDGWHRHPRSGRYRPGGDASREYTKEDINA